MIETIRDRVNKLTENISDIATSCGINSDDINLIAVSKKQSVAKIVEAQNAGIKYLGENKVQEFVEKYESPEITAKWHFIGHLQTNKVKYIIDKVDLIHSVDSLRLVEKISEIGEKNNIESNILLQVNTSQESTKFGFNENELIDQLTVISKLNHVKVLGLMAMAPFTENVKEISKSFSRLRILSENIKKMKPDNIQMQYLSMGMSNDYEIAIKEGSNMLRIGTSIFGVRN